MRPLQTMAMHKIYILSLTAKSWLYPYLGNINIYIYILQYKFYFYDLGNIYLLTY